MLGGLILRRLYIALGLFFIFIFSLVIFGRNIPSISVATTTKTTLQGSSFPLMTLKLGENTINKLHGYSSELASREVRESITPLDTSKSFQLFIDEKKSKIKRLDYEVTDIANKKSIETNNVTAFSSEHGNKTAKITISTTLDTSTEYGLKITLTTNLSKKIYFYTRIKYYENDFFLNEKLQFVKKFHNATFGKEQNFPISKYLEANTNDDSTLAKVDIHSSVNLIQWGNLTPKRLSTVVPTIKEFNIETAAISQVYFVSAKTNDGTEIYQVKEFYRVRYSQKQLYLLHFNRTMEAVFQPNLISVTKSEMKIGITSHTDMEIAATETNKKFAFVRNGSLWYYDLTQKKLYQVFTFARNSQDYDRDYYDQHDLRILKIEDNGNISFAVYGYMNCGDYEGRVGILLYDFNAKKNQITERVYLPISTTYQQLKEDFGRYCYINNNNVFYFSLKNKVYSYNISAKHYETLTDNASTNDFMMLPDATSFVWSNATKKTHATELEILNLQTTKQSTVKAGNNESIIALGSIDSNIVYGYVRNSDIHESATGDDVLPAYKLVISTCQGEILREYQGNNTYITSASIDGNVIRLKRYKKSGNRWVKLTDDSIMNQKNNKKNSIDFTKRVTEKALTEWYISLPAGYVMDALPQEIHTNAVMITENTTMHLKTASTDTNKYYVYANGGIIASTTSAAKAIQKADEQMGSVMDSESHIVWERGGKFLSKQIANISYPAKSTSTTKACTQMLLQAAQVTVSTSDLAGNSIMKMLRNKLDNPVNLTGCTLDEVLYFVSSEHPVIGMTSEGRAVLITGYDSSHVTWMDPSTKSSKTMSLTSAEKLFESAGYVFISYVAF